MARMKKSSMEYSKHRVMILSPWDWPCYPSLPLKRPVKDQPWPQLAILIASRTYVTPLNEEAIDGTKPITIIIANLHEKLIDKPTITYQDVDALLADGWVVD